MADSQHDLNYTDDASVEQFFDLECYYEGACAEPDGNLDSEAQAPNEPRPQSQIPGLELHQDQAISSGTVASMSLNNEMAMADVLFGSVGEPSQPATHIGNQSLHQYEQPSGTDRSNTEIVNIDARIEEIDLVLECRELQNRRHTIIQNLPKPQQAQASERPEFHILCTTSDSGTQFNSQGVASREASQGKDLFVSIMLELLQLIRYPNDIVSQPTGIARFHNNWVDHSYGTDTTTSSNDPRQNVPVGTGFRYDTALSGPSNVGFADLSNNAHRGSSHYEVLGQPSKASIDLSNTHSVYLPNHMPAGPPNSGPNNHCGIQGPVPGLGSDQTIMQTSLTESQRKDGLNLERVQHVSALSSSQHDGALRNSERSMINRKRLRPRQPTKAQRLSTNQRQLAKKSGVPEISLSVMCYGEESSSKRKRTSSQKRNKKEVMDAGGSCFLCRVFKKNGTSSRHEFLLSSNLLTCLPVLWPTAL